MTIYTRTGDQGETSLFGGGRVSKHHPRVTAYGEVDELNAALGMAAAVEPARFEHELLESIQRDLFAIGGQLATPRPDRVAGALEKAVLPDERVAELERAIDRAAADVPALSHFILPGGGRKGAFLHYARTICRRAERAVVELNLDEPVPPVVIPYLNRLSDLLFALARLANQRENVTERIW